MRKSSHAGCARELTASVLAKHVRLRRAFRVLHDARWLVEQAVRFVTRRVGRESL